MFALNKTLVSAALCLALTAPTQASTPMDEDTATNSSPPTWDIGVSNAAKRANANHPLMSLNRGTLTELCQILAENGHADAIANLGQTSIHMAGRILKPVRDYPELFQDEFTRINNPDMRQAIRVELRKAINARADELVTRQKELEAQSKDQPKPEPKAPILAPWQELLGENASLQHLIWALQMLQPQNIKRLGKNGLLEQLTARPDKLKALALGAAAAQIFTDKIEHAQQGLIIRAVLESSRPLSTYGPLGTACKQHLFTDQIDGYDQGCIISAALDSFCPLSEYEALAAGCKEHFFTAGMQGGNQSSIIIAALASSCPISEYATRGAACRKHLFTDQMDAGPQRYIITHAALQPSFPDVASVGAACKQHLFTDKMDGWDHAFIIIAALNSSRPASEYAAFGTDCKQHLFTEEMNGGLQHGIITTVLDLSDEQLARLVAECAARPGDDSYIRKYFIHQRTKQLLAGK